MATHELTTTSIDQELLGLTQRLLLSIATGDWETYEQLCDPTLSAFEPEAHSQQVHGMGFHKFYFDLRRDGPASQASMIAPHVRMLGTDAAVVSYVRLLQYVDRNDQPQTACFEETRVWQRQEGKWRHVHFHRSGN